MSHHTLKGRDGARVPKFLRKGATILKKLIFPMADCNEAEIAKVFVGWLLLTFSSCP